MKNAVPGRPWDRVAICVGEVLYSRGLVAWSFGGFLMLAGAKGTSCWFLAGRCYGRKIMALMCRVSISPNSCIRKSELVFSRNGALTALLSKFIPGVGGLVPPLAGALGMHNGAFTLLNLTGAFIWTASCMGLGLVFRQPVQQPVHQLERMESAAFPLLAAGAVLYLGFLITRRLLADMRLRKTPRVLPRELAEMFADGVEVVLIDARGPYGPAQARIPGARTWTDEEIAAIQAAAGGPEHVTYCDCLCGPGRLRLRKRGVQVRVLAGGLQAWIAAAFPLESQGSDPHSRPAGTALSVPGQLGAHSPS